MTTLAMDDSKVRSKGRGQSCQAKQSKRRPEEEREGRKKGEQRGCEEGRRQLATSRRGAGGLGSLGTNGAEDGEFDKGHVWLRTRRGSPGVWDEDGPDGGEGQGGKEEETKGWLVGRLEVRVEGRRERAAGYAADSGPESLLFASAREDPADPPSGDLHTYLAQPSPRFLPAQEG